MEANRYLALLWKRWLIILVCAIVGGALGLAYSLTQTPQYRATASVFFSLSGGDSVSQLLQGSTFTQNQVRSFAILATKPVVLNPVIDELGLDMSVGQLKSSITADAPLDTSVLDIVVTNPDPVEAAAIANAVSAQLSEEVQRIYPADEDGGSVGVRATPVADASVPSVPATPKTKINTAVGIILGAIAGIVFVVARELLSNKVDDEEVVRELTDVPLVGTIGRDNLYNKSPLVDPQTKDRRVESFRRLRTNVEYLNYADDLKSILITSSVPGEGKTTTSVNLALAMAETSKVLLIDADLRRPTVADRLGLDNTVGLAGVLGGRVDLATAIQSWNRGRLDVLTAGEVPPNPGELLGSHAMKGLLAQLGTEYDTILLDAPPLLPVSDATSLAKLADGTIIVVNSRKTTRNQFRSSLSSFSMAGLSPSGILLNLAPETKSLTYSSYE